MKHQSCPSLTTESGHYWWQDANPNSELDPIHVFPLLVPSLNCSHSNCIITTVLVVMNDFDQSTWDTPATLTVTSCYFKCFHCHCSNNRCWSPGFTFPTAVSCYKVSKTTWLAVASVTLIVETHQTDDVRQVGLGFDLAHLCYKPSHSTT